MRFTDYGKVWISQISVQLLFSKANLMVNLLQGLQFGSIVFVAIGRRWNDCTSPGS